MCERVFLCFDHCSVHSFSAPLTSLLSVPSLPFASSWLRQFIAEFAKLRQALMSQGAQGTGKSQSRECVALLCRFHLCS